MPDDWDKPEPILHTERDPQNTKEYRAQLLWLGALLATKDIPKTDPEAFLDKSNSILVSELKRTMGAKDKAGSMQYLSEWLERVAGVTLGDKLAVDAIRDQCTLDAVTERLKDWHRSQVTGPLGDKSGYVARNLEAAKNFLEGVK